MPAVLGVNIPQGVWSDWRPQKCCGRRSGRVLRHDPARRAHEIVGAPHHGQACSALAQDVAPRSGGRARRKGSQDAHDDQPRHQAEHSQGSPISPLLSNLSMRWFILGWKRRGAEQGLGAQIVNYADDLVICCKALQTMRRMMGQLNLTVNEERHERAACRKRSSIFWVHLRSAPRGENQASLISLPGRHGRASGA